MKSSDLLTLLGLLRRSAHPQWTVRSLAGELHLPQAAVQRSLVRLGHTPAYDPTNRRINLSATETLLRDALPFVAPGKVGGPTRGVPTAWAAPVLSRYFGPVDELPPVWPAPEGEARGLTVEPLHPAAVELARADAWMYEMLALLDGVRLGDARVRGIAQELLHERLVTAAGR